MCPLLVAPAPSDVRHGPRPPPQAGPPRPATPGPSSSPILLPAPPQRRRGARIGAVGSGDSVGRNHTLVIKSISNDISIGNKNEFGTKTHGRRPAQGAGHTAPVSFSGYSESGAEQHRRSGSLRLFPQEYFVLFLTICSINSELNRNYWKLPIICGSEEAGIANWTRPPDRNPSDSHISLWWRCIACPQPPALAKAEVGSASKPGPNAAA